MGSVSVRVTDRVVALTVETNSRGGGASVLFALPFATTNANYHWGIAA